MKKKSTLTRHWDYFDVTGAVEVFTAQTTGLDQQIFSLMATVHSFNPFLPHRKKKKNASQWVCDSGGLIITAGLDRIWADSHLVKKLCLSQTVDMLANYARAVPTNVFTRPTVQFTGQRAYWENFHSPRWLVCFDWPPQSCSFSGALKKKIKAARHAGKSSRRRGRRLKSSFHSSD